MLFNADNKALNKNIHHSQRADRSYHALPLGLKPKHILLYSRGRMHNNILVYIKTSGYVGTNKSETNCQS